MEAKKWEAKIRQMLKASEIEPKKYAPLIQTLASILEKRDLTLEHFELTGGKPVVMYTNKGGKSNPVKNPYLVLWDDLNKSALAYWRDLGLTPSSYRKMTGDTPKRESGGALAEALANLGV